MGELPPHPCRVRELLVRRSRQGPLTDCLRIPLLGLFIYAMGFLDERQGSRWARRVPREHSHPRGAAVRRA